jgi:hypothetical protein
MNPVFIHVIIFTFFLGGGVVFGIWAYLQCSKASLIDADVSFFFFGGGWGER